MSKGAKRKGSPAFNPESTTARFVYCCQLRVSKPPKLARYVRRGLFLPAAGA